MSEDLIKEAVALARAGRKKEALPLLQQVLAANPKNELAWLWLADCLPTLDLRIHALETFVRTAPEAKQAQAGLAALRREKQAAEDQAAAEPPAAEILSEVDQLPAAVEIPAVGDLPQEELFMQEASWLEDAQAKEEEEEDDLSRFFKTGPLVLPITHEPPAGAVEPETGAGEESAAEPGPGISESVPETGLEPLSGPPPQEEIAEPALEAPPGTAFTVPIENVTEEEFSPIEARTQAALKNAPAIRPIKAQTARARASRKKQPGGRKKINAGQVLIYVLIALIVLLGTGILVIGLLINQGWVF